MKRILYVITQTHYGGAQKYVYDLALTLSNNDNFEVKVAVGEGIQEPWMSKLVVEGIEVIRLKHVKRNLSPWHDFLSGFELLRLYRKTKPDVIHLNSSKVGATGAVVAWFYKMMGYLIFNPNYLLIVHTVHGLVLNEPLSLFHKAFYWFSEWFGALFKDVLICVSEHDKQSLLKYSIAPEKKIRVVHNGINISEVPFLSRDKARTKLSRSMTYNLKSETFLIGTIAGNYKTKGLIYALEAINSLPQKVKDVLHYVIVGDGPERNTLEKYIQQHNLNYTVTLTIVKENAAKYLKAFDMFILPSIKEGLSYTLIEARVAGLPIIATKVGGNPEVITHNQTGLLVSPANPQELTEVITRLYSNTSLRETLANTTQEELDMFSLKRMVSNTVQYYS